MSNKIVVLCIVSGFIIMLSSYLHHRSIQKQQLLLSDPGPIHFHWVTEEKLNGAFERIMEISYCYKDKDEDEEEILEYCLLTIKKNHISSLMDTDGYLRLTVRRDAVEPE